MQAELQTMQHWWRTMICEFSDDEVNESDCWESQRLYFGIRTVDLIPKYILEIPLLYSITI